MSKLPISHYLEEDIELSADAGEQIDRILAAGPPQWLIDFLAGEQADNPPSSQPVGNSDKFKSKEITP